MSNFNEQLDSYAKLVIEVGINVQDKQPLVISGPIEGADFVRLLAKNAYEKGASEVYVNWSDDTLIKLKYENSPMEVFEEFPKWKQDIMLYYAEKGAGFVSVHASDPYLLKDIEPKKISVSNKTNSLGMKDFRKYTMNDINSWCVISIPTKGWAKTVFNDVVEEKAIKLLWDAIFKATRVNLDDPTFAWKDHKSTLEEKTKYLNEKQFKSLHYTSSNETDLLVNLPENHIWSGGASINSEGVHFVANMPTEEVYTLPHRDRKSVV